MIDHLSRPRTELKCSERPERGASRDDTVQREPVENLSGFLDRICDLFSDGARDHVSVRELLDVIGGRAYGPLLLAIGLFAISPISYIPGLTWATALIALIVSVQMAVSWRTPWLPRSALEASFSRVLLIKSIDVIRPWARRVDRFVKPRLAFLAAPPFANLFGVASAGAALTCFPLGLIPFGPTAPTFAIALIGLGVTAKDGAVLLLSAAPLAIGVWLLI